MATSPSTTGITLAQLLHDIHSDTATAPQTTSSDIARLADLLERYPPGHPPHEQFESHSVLYDDSTMMMDLTMDATMLLGAADEDDGDDVHRGMSGIGGLGVDPAVQDAIEFARILVRQDTQWRDAGAAGRHKEVEAAIAKADAARKKANDALRVMGVDAEAVGY